MKKQLIPFIVAVLSIYSLNAQRVDYSKLAAPNPNVAALVKPVLTPVAEYAGLSSINIPMYVIQEDGVQVPISIDYQTGGIQVSEEASSVGLGWALNAGGVISRDIQGDPDFGESPSNFLYNRYYKTARDFPDHEETTVNSSTFFSPPNNTYRRSDNQARLPVNGVPTYFPPFWDTYTAADNQPDIFYYNFNGYSGSFVFDREGGIFQLEKNGLIIEHQPTDGAGNPVANIGAPGFNSIFKITAQDGTVYYFGEQAKTRLSIFDTPTTYTSTWHLTKITTPNNRTVDFEYNPIGGAVDSHFWPIKSFSQRLWNSSSYRNSHGPQSKIDDLYLTKITFSNGEIDFNYSDEGIREDIPHAHYLESVTVKSGSETIKNFDFNYSYFGSVNTPNGTIDTGDYSSVVALSASNPSLNLRLKLDGLIENNTLEHSFDYFEVSSSRYPNKTSMSQDYWGFYNGITNPRSFIPNIYIDNSFFIVPIKAKRYPVASKAKLFSLKRITYPTKGYTEFDYESNTYDKGIDYNFWESSYIPVPDTFSPLATIPREEYALSSGSENWVIQPFSVNTGLSVNVKFQLAIRGTSLEPSSSGIYPNGPFNFQEDMSVILRRSSDNQIIWQQGYFSEQASLDFQNTGMAFFNSEIDQPLPGGEYTLEAYFNDYNQTYFGQARIVAAWEEESEVGDPDNPKDYSIGGGLRINSITDYDNTERRVKKRNFNYHYKQNIGGQEIEKSYGRFKIVPKFNLDYPYVQTSPQTVCFDVGLNTTCSTNVGDPNDPNDDIEVCYSDGLASSCVSFADYGQYIASAGSTNPLGKDRGSYVTYGQVEMTYEDLRGDDNGKTISKFFNFRDYNATGNNLGLDYVDMYYDFPSIRIPHTGKMYEQEQYKRNTDDTYTLVSESKNEYKVNGLNAEGMTFQGFISNPATNLLMTGVREFIPYFSNVYLEGPDAEYVNSLYHFHPLYGSRVELHKTQQITYDENGQNPVTATEEVFYDNPIHYMPTRTEMVDSEGNTVTTQIWYADDIDQGAGIEGGAFQNYTTMEAFKNNGQNPRVGQPIQRLTVNNGQKTLERTNFFDWGNGILQPDSQQFIKGEVSAQNLFQDMVLAYDYDDYGNPLEFSKDNGPITSYIWGYNKKYLIAKIENASYQDIADALNTTRNAVKAFTENDLSTIAGLRTSLTKAMVTTYTYDPLVGVTTTTDPRGYTMTYRYDDLNRLIEVKDGQDHIVSDYKYHYKGQTN